jgi:hypothetical protein
MVLLLESAVDILPHQLRFIKSGSPAALRNDVQAAGSKLAEYLMIAVEWTVRQIRKALDGLWRFSRVQELFGWIRVQVPFILKWIEVQTLFILKWCAILIITVFGIVLVIRYGPGLAKMVVAQVKRHLEMRLYQRRMRKAELEQERLIAERKAREAREAKEAADKKAKDDADKKAALQREAQEAQKRRDKEVTRNRNIKKQYEVWKRQCTAAFKNPETMDHFPYPPVVPCTDSVCDAARTPTPCRHNLELLFKASGVAAPA